VPFTNATKKKKSTEYKSSSIVNYEEAAWKTVFCKYPMSASHYFSLASKLKMKASGLSHKHSKWEGLPPQWLISPNSSLLFYFALCLLLSGRAIWVN
jgi:hypothetical protein